MVLLKIEGGKETHRIVVLLSHLAAHLTKSEFDLIDVPVVCKIAVHFYILLLGV